MATGAARRPSGKVSVVFDRSRDREGAYDFLESPQVDASAVARSMFSSTVSRAKGADWVYVAIDGSALSLPDGEGAKGFGPVGSSNAPVTGLKVMNALAIDRHGVPLGLVDQIFWKRPRAHVRSRREQRERNARRRFEKKETAHFVHAAKSTAERLGEVGVRPWVLIDREADNRDIIRGLLEAKCHFTVRARWDRCLLPAGSASLQAHLDRESSLGTYEIDVRRRGKPSRKALVDVRAAQVTLLFERRGAQKAGAARLYAVRLRETKPRKDAVDWLLYTNVPVFTVEHAKRIVASYDMRWRVEEFHKTWKQGHCNVEHAQLHSIRAVRLWATILAAVATRIERLKYLAREQPDALASVELSGDEIEGLKLDQQQRWPRQRVPAMPTIAEATMWLGELGGWIRRPNVMPGSITLARGLDRLSYLLEGIALARRPSARLRRT